MSLSAVEEIFKKKYLNHDYVVVVVVVGATVCLCSCDSSRQIQQVNTCTSTIS